MSVGLVLVSHSRKLAEGLAEVAAQMAPGVTIVPAGGLPDGGIGTDYDGVLAAAERADSGDGVVLLYDLGSARMTADLVIEAVPGTALLADAPFVEGTVAAAVAAQGPADRFAVAAAATRRRTEPEVGVDADRAELELTNDVGLHARPAAVLARSLSGIEADVSVVLGEQEADAHSVLALMALGARKGDRIEVLARGPQAGEALRTVRGLVERNFDESGGV